MSSKNKRPNYDEDLDSPEENEDVNERERMERRAKNTPPKICVNVKEAVGNVVAFVNSSASTTGIAAPHNRRQSRNASALPTE